ncbi:hypothetical protein HELRODRAFT_159934 [Helobdella robusta]|uniref:Ig-like domain-containing protein n=1 Tax=Helobdella robusta TaxID=6412 RepID=T1EPK7_HELRO|nr:hypothetical protein HELRODRAFT_159934 [Helobdella robusta]ESO05856.1 hypothetical protein HELRODRAFT_159934 [Helobdella robusta]
MNIKNNKHTALPPNIRLKSRNADYLLDEGSSVVMVCEFLADWFNAFEQPLLWLKTQKNQMVHMNLAGTLKEPFASSKRFEVSLSTDKRRHRFQLVIKEVSNADSGVYTCEIRGKQMTLLAQVNYTLNIKGRINFTANTKKSLTSKIIHEARKSI